MLRADQPQPGTLTLSGAATLDQAAVLYSALEGLLPASGQATVDLAQLHDIDTAGLQILLAFARTRGSSRVRFTHWPEPLRQRVLLIGLAELLA